MEYKIVDETQAESVANLAVCLTNEIIEKTGVRHFNVDIPLVKKLCKEFIEKGQYTVIAALDNNVIVGCGALCVSYSLYAEGAFGIVQELYVLPEYRSQLIGKELLKRIIDYAKSQQWVRLELCTPPIPEFDRTVSFYKENGFEITGGYKMKYVIT